MAVNETRHYPAYDPAITYNVEEKLYAERLCVCGGILRIRGEYPDVAKFVAYFEREHVGAGHGLTDDKVAVMRARELKRYTGFVQARNNTTIKDIPIDAQYAPTNWDEKNIGVTNGEVYAEGSGLLQHIEKEEAEHFRRLTTEEDANV